MFWVVIMLLSALRPQSLASAAATDEAPVFPLFTFFNQTEPRITNGVDEMNQHLCNTRSSTNSTHCPCSCHWTCVRHGRCCIDFLWSAPPGIPLQNMQEYKYTLIKEWTRKQSCLPIAPFGERVRDHAIMIDSCLPATDIRDILRCFEIESIPNAQMIPVLGNDDQLVYKNAFCAKCNFKVQQYQVIEWEISCPIVPSEDTDPDNVTDILRKNTFCSIQPGREFKSTVNKCSPELCLHDWPMFCQLFEAPFIEYGEKFKNIFCHNCLLTAGREEENFKNLTCQRPGGPSIGNPYFSGWSRTISLSFFESADSADCHRGVLGACITPTKKCGIGFRLDGGKCKEKNKPLEVVDFNVGSDSVGFSQCLFKQRPELFVTIKNTSDSSLTVLKFLTMAKQNFNITTKDWTLEYTNESVIVMKKVTLTTEKDWNEIWKYWKSGEVPKGVQNILLTSAKNHINSHVYGFDIGRTFKNYNLCASVIKTPPSPRAVNMTCQELFSFHSREYNSSNINLQTSINVRGPIINTEETVLVCQMFHLTTDCFREEITIEKYSIDNNQTLRFNASDGGGEKTYVFFAEEYIPTPIGFEVCASEHRGTKTPSTYAWLLRAQSAKYYISLVGTVLSIICYVLLLLAFYQTKELCNTGGLNTLVLSCFMLVSDTTFLITTGVERNTSSCKWLGLFLHWTLLTVSAWSIALSIDMALQFTTKTAPPVLGDRGKVLLRKTIYENCCYCICCTLSVIILAIILNETESVLFKYEAYCWIGNFYVALCFYYVPVLIAYLVCLSSLVVVVRSIKQTNSASKEILKDNKRKHVHVVHIAIKLMLILGITEGLGFIQIPQTSSHRVSEDEMIFNTVFGIMYDVARSLRGVLICVVNLGNKRTMELIKQRLSANNNNNSKDITMSHTISNSHS